MPLADCAYEQRCSCAVLELYLSADTQLCNCPAVHGNKYAAVHVDGLHMSADT